MSTLPYIGTTQKGLTKEFKVALPCGHIAGKTWGNPSHTPVLCMHGWLDNCNTFDSLIPILPKNYFYVAFDFLGHGLSSHVPEGGWYHRVENLATIKRVVNHFEWKSFVILGHSLGANMGGYFSALYPELVEKCICLDAPGVFISAEESLGGSQIRKSIDGYLNHEMADHPPVKSYSYEEAKTRLHKGFFQLTSEAADVLLERSLKEVEPGKFIFRRDFRHRLSDPMLTSPQTGAEVYKNIKCDMLILSAKEGIIENAINKTRHAFLKKLMDKTLKENLYFEHVPGNHHVHLNNPENVAAKITQFLQTEPTYKINAGHKL